MSRAQGITGGELYAGHPAVGLIELSNGGQCTGTLIGNKTVLTAAHCFKAPGYTFTLDNGEIISATSWHDHPDFQGDNTPYDIGVIKLARAPKNVVPLPVSTKSPSVGQTILLVGYGVTYCEPGPTPQTLNCKDDGGVKRQSSNQIASVSQIEFTFEGTGSTCKGDSGGPAFAKIDGKEVCVGVTSRGKMPCGKEGIDTRVDKFVDWLAQISEGDLNRGDPPQVMLTDPPDGATIPGGEQVIKARASDDSGHIKEVKLLVDGAEVGKLPGKADDLPYRFSVQLPAGPHALKVVASDHDGGQGEATATITVDDSEAPPTTPKPLPGAFGAECEEPSDCDSGMCAADANAGRSYCTEPCDPDGADCPSSGRCMATANAQQHVCALVFDSPPPNADEGEVLIGGCSAGGQRADRFNLRFDLLGLLLLLAFARRR